MDTDSKIYVAGHRGLVGSAIVRLLRARGYDNIMTRTHSKLDLTVQRDVEEFFLVEEPEYVFFAAAKVGGIMANMKNPAVFIHDNLAIQSNVIHMAHVARVKKMIFVSSSCSYPRMCPQPMKEDYILDGKPEPTNEYYAVAKIAGMKMAEAYHREYGSAFTSLMFPNLYGPGDNFDLNASHVIPALIRKVYDAKTAGDPEVEIWGTGKARREFLYVDDVADACLYFMDRCTGGEVLNVGSSSDITIRDLAYLVKDLVGYEGQLTFNTAKPDGMPRKLLDASGSAKLGWSPKLTLAEGIRNTLDWYVENIHLREHV